MTRANVSMQDALGDRYEVQGEVGRGGMAVVYRAFDRQLGRTVAVKVLHAELTRLVGPARFRREVTIAAKLQHPNIVPVFESSEHDDLLFYIMPLVEGESLRARLAKVTQLPLPEALRIASDVASALSYAHEHGIVHRDIKPENILLQDGRALVTDFGLARAIAQVAGDELTSSGFIAGTPAYMSPEQAGGATDLDARTDVYSLACVLYEMLAGETPYTGPSAQAVVAKQMSQPPPSLRVLRGSVPPAIDAAVQRGLAKVPADRFATALEFADALSQARELSRRPRPRTLLLGAAALIAVGSAVTLLGPLRGKWDHGAAASVEPLVHIGVLPIAVRGDGADSTRVQQIQDLFVSELARNRGLAVVDPSSLRSRLLPGASGAAADVPGALRRLGLQYAVRITTTATAEGLQVAYALSDATGGSIVETGAFTASDEARLPAQVRQACGRLAAALDVATGGMAKGLDVEPFLRRAPKPAALNEFLQGIEYTYRFLPGGGEHFKRALELDPDFIGPRAFLVSGLLDRGDTAAARAHVQVLVALKSRATPFEQAVIGWCESAVRGDLDGMVRHSRVSLSYSPHNNIALFTLASDLFLAGRLQEAVEPTREAMASGWRFAPLYTLWVQLAIESGNLSGLRDTLVAELSFAAPDPYGAGLLEALALYDGDSSAARSDGAAFRAAIGDGIAAAYSELAGSYRSLAQRARARGRLATSASLLRRAVSGGAAQPILRLELARVLAESGNRREAESYYRSVAASELGRPDALSVAGDVAELLGRTSDARNDFTKYLRIAPDGPDAARVKERLRALERSSSSIQVHTTH